jgi:multiple sugar transport system substrate-binding protein
MAPEGRFPIRPGPNAGSKIFIEEWGNLPIGVDRKVPINQIYSQEIIESLINGLSVGTRWGASEGQLPLAAKLVNSGLMNRLMMEYINGDRTAEETVNMLNSEAAKL